MEYVFSMRTVPEGVGFLFDVKDPPLRLDLAGIEGQKCKLAFLLSGGLYFAVSVATERVIADIATFRNQIATISRSLFNAATFLSGTAIDIQVASLTEVETGRFWTFQDAVPELTQSAHERPLPIERFISLAVSDSYLRSALRDLNDSIASPNDTAFYCYRAIETLMQAFKQAGQNKGQAWGRLREALRVTQGWIKPLTDESESRRHGEIKALSGPERIHLMKSSWTLVYRFVRLKLQDGASLPESEFPLLDA